MNIKIKFCIFLLLYIFCIDTYRVIAKPKIKVKVVENTEVVEKEVEKIVYRYKVEYIPAIEKDPIIVTKEIGPSFAYTVSSVEREMIARILYREGGSGSFESQCMIVSVIFNRLDNGYWGNTIKEVLSSEGQFSTYRLYNYTTPKKANYEAVDYVIKNGVTIPPYVLYFRSKHHFKWDNYVGYAVKDGTYFGYLKSDKTKYEKLLKNGE